MDITYVYVKVEDTIIWMLEIWLHEQIILIAAVLFRNLYKVADTFLLTAHT